MFGKALKPQPEHAALHGDLYLWNYSASLAGSVRRFEALEQLAPAEISTPLIFRVAAICSDHSITFTTPLSRW
jgi:hypothetical protein